jgi:hypothetical protein
MRANRGRKFKAPRLLKDKEPAKQNESDEDDIPFSEIREKVRAETKVSDNEEDIPFSEIREKVRAETKGSDSEEDNIPFSQIKTKTTISSGNTRKDRPAPEKADETLKKAPRTSWTKEDVEDPMKMVGCPIARDFGDSGIYLGEVIGIEYDSDDEDKVSIELMAHPLQGLILNIWPYFTL